MICPLCHTDGDPAASAGAISVCAACGATAATDRDGSIRAANAFDIQQLDLGDLQRLRRARGAIVRPKL